MAHSSKRIDVALRLLFLGSYFGRQWRRANFAPQSFNRRPLHPALRTVNKTPPTTQFDGTPAASALASGGPRGRRRESGRLRHRPRHQLDWMRAPVRAERASDRLGQGKAASRGCSRVSARDARQICKSSGGCVSGSWGAGGIHVDLHAGCS